MIRVTTTRTFCPSLPLFVPVREAFLGDQKNPKRVFGSCYLVGIIVIQGI